MGQARGIFVLSIRALATGQARGIFVLSARALATGQARGIFVLSIRALAEAGLEDCVDDCKDESRGDATQQDTRKTFDNTKQTPVAWQQHIAVPNRRKAHHREVKRRFKITKQLLRVIEHGPKTCLNHMQQQNPGEKHDNQYRKPFVAGGSLELLAPVQERFRHQQYPRNMYNQRN